jgi:hypothetical protein
MRRHRLDRLAKAWSHFSLAAQQGIEHGATFFGQR